MDTEERLSGSGNCPLHIDWPVDARPVIRICGRFAHAGKRFSRRYSGQPIALHCYEYGGRIRIDGQLFNLGVGDVTLTAAWQVAGYDLPTPGHHLCVHFGLSAAEPSNPGTAERLAGPAGVFRLPSHVPAARAHVDGEPFAEVLLRVIRLHTVGEVDPLARASAALALQRLLLALGMTERSPAVSVPVARGNPVDRAAVQLRSQLDEPLDVSELARTVGLSQNYLARLFKQRFGMTVPHYLLRHRLAYAMLLLTTTDLPIGRIGVRMGMPDPQHFNKQFRNLYGVSPSMARRIGVPV